MYIEWSTGKLFNEIGISSLITLELKFLINNILINILILYIYMYIVTF